MILGIQKKGLKVLGVLAAPLAAVIISGCSRSSAEPKTEPAGRVAQIISGTGSNESVLNGETNLMETRGKLLILPGAEALVGRINQLMKERSEAKQRVEEYLRQEKNNQEASKAVPETAPEPEPDADQASDSAEPGDGPAEEPDENQGEPGPSEGGETAKNEGPDVKTKIKERLEALDKVSALLEAEGLIMEEVDKADLENDLAALKERLEEKLGRADSADEEAKAALRKEIAGEAVYAVKLNRVEGLIFIYQARYLLEKQAGDLLTVAEDAIKDLGARGLNTADREEALGNARRAMTRAREKLDEAESRLKLMLGTEDATLDEEYSRDAWQLIEEGGRELDELKETLLILIK